jgi:hypothetical protein
VGVVAPLTGQLLLLCANSSVYVVYGVYDGDGGGAGYGDVNV